MSDRPIPVPRVNRSLITRVRVAALSLFCNRYVEVSVNEAPNPSIVWYVLVLSTVRFTAPEETEPSAMLGCGVSAFCRSSVVRVTPIVVPAATAGDGVSATIAPVAATANAMTCTGAQWSLPASFIDVSSSASGCPPP